jgi:hypothetical protein
MKKLAACLAAMAWAASVASSATAAIIYNETFSYPDGQLTTVSGGLWANHSGTGTFFQVTGGKTTASQGSGSREDVHRDFGTTLGAGGQIFAAFDVTVNGPAALSGLGGDVYFAHTYVNATTFPSRIFVTALNGSDYTFGLGNLSANPSVIMSTGFTYNTTHRVVLSYAFDTGVTDFWVDPVNQASPKITFNAAVSSALTAFAFRQGSAPTTQTDQTLDNLVVATTITQALTGVPEPATAGLGLAGVLGLIGLRRRVR